MTRDLAAYLVWILRIAARPMAGALVLIVAAALTEGLGLSLLPSILGVAGLNLGGGIPLPLYTRNITGTLAAIGLGSGLAALLVAFFILVSLRTLLGRLQYTAMIALDQTSLATLREQLYRAIVRADWTFLCQARPSEFMHVLTTEVTRVGQITILLLMLCAEIVLGVVYAVITFALSPLFALMMLAGSVLLVGLLSRTARPLFWSGAEFSAAMQRLHCRASDSLHHLKTTKTFGGGGRHLQLFQAANEHVTRAALDIGRRRASASALFEGGSLFMLCAMIYVLVTLLHVPAGSVLLLLLIFSRLMPHLQSGHEHFRELVAVLPAFVTVREQIERCERAAEPPDEGRQVPRLQQAVSLEGVTFAYPGRKVDAVRNLDIEVPVGKIVALVGPSGAGKSTTIDLVMGLLAPRSGVIRIDGRELAPGSMLQWRNQIGYVAADASLFNVSIRDNLLWASGNASDDDILAALELAGATDFVQALPHGLDSIVGESGLLFSQGQRQRLALARAVLRKPALLILDEATNGLDAETEVEVMGRLAELVPRSAVLLVAHRLSTIRWADVIYVLDNGCVVEHGGRNDLDRRAGSRFRSLCAAQYLEVRDSIAHARRR